MAVAFRAAGTVVSGATNVANPTALTPVKHASTATGDVMVAITMSRSITATVATPSGWNLVSGFPKRSGTASGGSFYAFTRTATGSDTCSISWSGVATGTSGDGSSAVILSYSGMKETLDGTVQVSDLSAQTNTSVIPAFTTGTANSQVIGAAFKIGVEAGANSVATFTERSDFPVTSGTGHIGEIADITVASAGSSGTATVTWGSATSLRVLAVSMGFQMAPVPATITPDAISFTFSPTLALTAATQLPLGSTSFTFSPTLDVTAPTVTTARLFDDVDDYIQTSLGSCNQTGAFTLAALVRSHANAEFHPVMENNTAADASMLGLEISTGDVVQLRCNNVARTATSPFVQVADGWCIIAVSKAAGTAVARFHVYKGGAWTHADPLGSFTSADSAAQGNIKFAKFSSAANYADIDLAVAAQWNVALTDAQAEELSVNWQTQDWLDDTGGAPVGLWQFNQASTGTNVVDYTGNGADQTSIVGTTVITTGPSDWVYAEPAPAELPLDSTSFSFAPALAVSAPTQIDPDPTSIAFSPSLAVSAPTRVPLDAGTSITFSPSALGVTTPSSVNIVPDPLTFSFSPSMTVKVPAGIPITSTPTITFTPAMSLKVLTKVPLASTAISFSPTLTLSAPTKVPLASTSITFSPTLNLGIAQVPDEPPAKWRHGEVKRWNPAWQPDVETVP